MLGIICLTALIASALTFFSGFGLGTILMPVFALYFPPQTAVALTAIVHLLNNLFKLILVARNVNKTVLLRFGLASVPAAFVGAYVLMQLSEMPVLFDYQAFGHNYHITLLKLLLAIVIVVFCLFDIIPALTKLNFDPKYLPLGGLLSGFFGGLSGNQGALRSAFLMRAGLNKESFVATGVVIACCIDVSRLSIYAGNMGTQLQKADPLLMGAATFSAFLGAFIGSRLLKKVTIHFFQYFVAVALILFALLMAAGIL